MPNNCKLMKINFSFHTSSIFYQSIPIPIPQAQALLHFVVFIIVITGGLIQSPHTLHFFILFIQFISSLTYVRPPYGFSFFINSILIANNLINTNCYFLIKINFPQSFFLSTIYNLILNNSIHANVFPSLQSSLYLFFPPSTDNSHLKIFIFHRFISWLNEQVWLYDCQTITVYFAPSQPASPRDWFDLLISSCHHRFSNKWLCT